MAQQDPQTLLAAANCYDCYADAGGRQLMILALLQQIVLNQNPMAATDPQSLLTQAQCYSCFSGSPGLMQLMELALLAQISQNGSTGGGGGSAQLVTYTAGVPANPTNTNAAALAYDPTGNLPTLGWNVGTQSWN